MPLPRSRTRAALSEPTPDRDDSPAELARIRREIGRRLERLHAVIMAKRDACAAQGRAVYPVGAEDFQLIPAL